MTIQGLDFEGRITDWRKAAQAGYRFAVGRAIQETGELDPDFKPNLSGSESVGMYGGGYHFIAGGGTVRDHAKRFIDALGDPTGRLVQLDVEHPSYHPNPTIDDVAAWFDVWRHASTAHANHPVLLYTGIWYWTGAGYPINRADGSRFTPYLWHSGGLGYQTATRYPGDTDPSWTARYGGWSGPTIWQYRGSIDIGLGAAVDLNAFRGDEAALAKLAGKEEPVGLNVINPNTMPGTVKVTGTGHMAIRINDGRGVAVLDGSTWGCLGTGSLTPPLDALAGNRTDVFLIRVNGALCVLLRSDGAFTPASSLTPTTATDCADAAAAAVEAFRVKVINAIPNG